MAAKRTSPCLAPSSGGLADAPEASAGRSGIHLLRRVEASHNPARLNCSQASWLAMVSEQERRALRGAHWWRNAPPHTPGAALNLGTDSSAFEP
jgi:hypothetical protein